LVDTDAYLVEHFLVELEIDWHFADVCKSERSLLASTDDHVAKVANIGADLDVVKVQGCSTDLDLFFGSCLTVVEGSA
jgi:hypothetical protein